MNQEFFNQEDNDNNDSNNSENYVILICNKSYKTKNGLIQHEKKKHSEYCGYPSNIPPHQYYLMQFKQSLIYNIKKN
jgi:hypothetical protein